MSREPQAVHQQHSTQVDEPEQHVLNMRYWGLLVSLATVIVGLLFPAYKSVVRVST